MTTACAAALASQVCAVIPEHADSSVNTQSPSCFVGPDHLLGSSQTWCYCRELQYTRMPHQQPAW